MISPSPMGSSYAPRREDTSRPAPQRRSMELFSIVESESENEVPETSGAAPAPSSPGDGSVRSVTQDRNRCRPSPPELFLARNGKSESSASISHCLKLYYPGGAAVATARARMRQQMRKDSRRPTPSGCTASSLATMNDSLDLHDATDVAAAAYLFPQTPLSPAEFEKRRCTSAALSRAACLERQDLSRTASRTSGQSSPSCVGAASSAGPGHAGRSKSREFACLLDLMKPNDYFETVSRGEYYPDYSNTAPFRKDDETVTATFWGNGITDRGRSLMTSQRARAA